MSKPLELVVYPPLECVGDRPKDRLKHEFAKGAEWKRGQAKRLTDVELAAEYWSQQMEVVRAVDRAYPWGCSDEVDIETARICTLERFATLPHYDEVPA